MHIVFRQTEELSSDERRTFRHKLIEQYVKLRIATYDYISQAGAVPPSQLADRYIGYLGSIQAVLRDLIKRYPPTPSEYRNLDSSQKRQLTSPLIRYYSAAHKFSSIAVGSHSLALANIDDELKSVCSSMGGISIDGGLADAIDRALRQAAWQNRENFGADSLISAVLLRWCGGQGHASHAANGPK